jgi:hypothetical protein
MTSKKITWSACDCPDYGNAFANANSPNDAPISGIIHADYVSFATGSEYACFPPAMPLAQIPGECANTYRLLPRAYTVEEVAAGATEIRLNYAGAFIPNDELVVLAPVGSFVVDAPAGADHEDTVWQEGENITITLDGYDVSLNLKSALLMDLGMTAQETIYNVNRTIALQLAQLINQQAKGKVVAYTMAVQPTAAAPMPTGFVVGMIACDHETAHPYAAATDAAAGTVTAAGATFAAAGAAVGSIMSVMPTAMGDGIGSITLAAPVAAAIPAGTPIGDIAYSPCSAGLWDGACALKIEKGCNRAVAAYCAGTYRFDRLPYWDGEMKNCFNQIKTV